MKLFVLAALIACSSPPKRGPDGKPERSPPKATAELVVTITDHVEINGTAIGARPMVADMIAVLGKPDRTWDQGGANKVHTWDKLGVLVYEPYDGRCISATFPFKPMSQTFTPATLYGGKFSVDGNALARGMKLSAVKQWTGATTPYTEASIVFDKDDVHVFTQAEQAPAGTLDLVEISFWQRDGDEAGEQDADEQACRGGDGAVCVRMALAYQTGHDVPQSPKSAFTYAKLGCDGGSAFGCTMLGNAHQLGFGTAVSLTAAKTAWARACKLGDAAACKR